MPEVTENGPRTLYCVTFGLQCADFIYWMLPQPDTVAGKEYITLPIFGVVIVGGAQ